MVILVASIETINENTRLSETDRVCLEPRDIRALSVRLSEYTGFSISEIEREICNFWGLKYWGGLY